MHETQLLHISIVDDSIYIRKIGYVLVKSCRILSCAVFLSIWLKVWDCGHYATLAKRPPFTTLQARHPAANPTHNPPNYNPRIHRPRIHRPRIHRSLIHRSLIPHPLSCHH